eukprot:CAMPEP_0196574702 /NCGR_PEP_ID=MMETSP1081-20130531/4354_1 /TAXON_ID=36882 /ORGANISM="Pyramimonas amylifera, Strain CCMP720" /LENGTH=77 /DNA_ID=CAMNT_0041892799 /DNA_START=122 /DNA_END=355 /DNA_ORIENTATION=-
MASAVQVLGSLGCVFTIAAGISTVVTTNKTFGGTNVGTMTNPEWRTATKEYLSNMPREGAPDSTVALNPFMNGAKPY